MNIGKFIKNHRKNLNMTQKELAKTLNVHFITLCRWETNFIKPNKLHWTILQNLFGTRKDNLIVPCGKSIKVITPLQKSVKNDNNTRNQEIVKNYKKGISVKDLAKFYNLKQNSIKSILQKTNRKKRKLVK